MTLEKVNSVISYSEKGPLFGVRHLQILLLFFCGFIAYWTRVNLSVAIVAMTNPVNPDFQLFDWDEKLKSYILSSFYWGYIFTQLPSGHLSHRYGTKLMLFITMAIPSILTILTPVCVSYGGWETFCAIRVAEGFFSGGIFPLFHNHLAHWCPVEERNRLGAITYSGVEIGTVIAFLATGLIAASSFGWPGAFYVPGIIGLVWCVVWYFYGANSPNDYKSISKLEKMYIESTLKDCKTEHPAAIPWKQILTSVPFIALIVVRISHSWGFQTLLTETPTYVNSVLKLDIKSNALYSSLPYLVMWILGFVFLFVAEILMKNDRISLTMIRKTLNSISQWGPALALIGLALSPPDNLPMALTFLIFAISLGSASTIGSVLNHIDLSPNYAGVLMGLANTVANFISIIVPIIIGLIVTNEENRSQWQIVFYTAAGLYFLGNLVYVIFGQMVQQPWNAIQR